MDSKISRILVPTDFSDQSRYALQYAVDLAVATGATIDLLHVWEPPRYVSPDLMLSIPGWSAVTMEQYSRAEAGKELEQFLAGVDTRNISVRARLDIGEASAAIVRHAREHPPDLIVMGTHGRSGLIRNVLGNVAQKVLVRAVCPVLTLKEGERAHA